MHRDRRGSVRLLARAAILASALLLLGAAPLPSERRLPPPGDPAWEVIDVGADRPTRYRAAEEDDGQVWVGDAECSCSGLAVSASQIDLSTTPVLRWRWWAERLPRPLDERTKEGDDFAGRVSVMFAFEPDEASLMERMSHGLIGLAVGREIPATALHFLWTVDVPPGTVWDNPRTERAKNWALERGPAPGWREAEIDIALAYRRAFGRDAPPLLAVGVMTDADDHCGRARGRYADFRFTAADPEAGPGIEAPHAPPR